MRNPIRAYFVYLWVTDPISGATDLRGVEPMSIRLDSLPTARLMRESLLRGQSNSAGWFSQTNPSLRIGSWHLQREKFEFRFLEAQQTSRTEREYVMWFICTWTFCEPKNKNDMVRKRTLNRVNIRSQRSFVRWCISLSVPTGLLILCKIVIYWKDTKDRKIAENRGKIVLCVEREDGTWIPVTGRPILPF